MFEGLRTGSEGGCRVWFHNGNRSIRSLTGVALALFCAVTAFGASPQKKYVLNCEGERPSPVVVVTNVCPWPNLTVLPNGEIAAILFNQPSHGRMPGELDCWVTADQGRTWERRTSPVMHKGSHDNRMNHAAGVAHNGDLIVISSGWTLIDKEVPIHDSTMDVDEVLDPVVCRSSDGGRTWSVSTNFPVRATKESGKFVPHADIIQGSGNTLRVAAYVSEKGKGRPFRAYVIESLDDGKTWGNPVVIDPRTDLNETFILRTGENRWLAAARGGQTKLYESTNSCRDWKPLGPVTEVNEIPAHFLKLKDGRLVLSYGRRVKGDEGVVVKISGDDGLTWSAPERIVDFIGFDGGYPSSVQLPDGQVLTAYYAKKVDYYAGRYHMGQVIWDPATTFPKSNEADKSE